MYSRVELKNAERIVTAFYIEVEDIYEKTDFVDREWCGFTRGIS
jgi:hypothetical protein